MNGDTSKIQLHRGVVYRRKHGLGGLPILVVLISVILLSFSGCGRSSKQSLSNGVKLPGRKLSKVEVKDTLRRFEDFFLTKTEEAAAEIYSLATTSRMQKTALLGKTRTAYALSSMMVQENPIASLFDTWCYCVRLREYFETGDGNRLFGDHQSVALDAAKENEAEIELVVKTLLGDKVFADTREHIRSFARSRPIKGTFSNMVVHATRVEEGTKGPLGKVLAVPMAPFKALEGVDRTPTAINRFTDTAAGFSDVVEEFPESARWQLLLLLYDLQETEMVESLLASMSEFSKSSAQIADSAEKLPKQLSDNLSKFVDEIDSKQGNLQKTLEQASKTATVIGGTLEEVGEVSDSFGQTANRVNEAAAAWEKAAVATGQVIKEFAKDEEATEEAESEEPFDIKDYRATAEVVSVSVSDLRKLLAEIREFAKSDEFDELASFGIGMSSRIIWRAALFAVVVFVLAVAYKIIAVRITDRGNRES